MGYRGFELSANVSMLFTELPYLDRYAAAARQGFTSPTYNSPTPPAEANQAQAHSRSTPHSTH